MYFFAEKAFTFIFRTEVRTQHTAVQYKGFCGLKSTTARPRSPLARLAEFWMVASTVCSRPEPIHAILPVAQGGTTPVYWRSETVSWS